MKHLCRSLGLSIALATLVACGVTSPLATEATTSDDSNASDAGATDTDPSGSVGGSITKDAGAPPKTPDAGSPTATPDETETKTAPPCGTGPGCDPSDFGGETCESLGLGEGRLLCDPTTCTIIVALCQGLDTDTPSIGPPCGTGPGCDPADLGDETCSSLGMGTGVLSCDPVTCLFDTSMCSGGGGSGGTGGGTGG